MLYLQDLAKQGLQTKILTIKERLPNFLKTPCIVNVSYQVESKEDFYILHLSVKGSLAIICQRCVQEFDYDYDNQTLIAICRTDERAEKLLEHYECIVAVNEQIHLDDVVVDELHLYAPEFHLDTHDCDSMVNQILGEKIET